MFFDEFLESSSLQQIEYRVEECSEQTVRNMETRWLAQLTKAERCFGNQLLVIAFYFFIRLATQIGLHVVNAKVKKSLF